MKIIRFFDKLEDRTRGYLSHFPIAYGLVAGVGMVLFWRGIWLLADTFSTVYVTPSGVYSGLGARTFWDGLISIGVSLILLLMTGSFVSTFIGNEIIISGLRGEKKLAEKTEAEVKTETGAIGEIQRDIRKMAERLEKIEKKIK